MKSQDTSTSEKLGETCMDGGTCHHECKDKCFRRESCVPLTQALNAGLTMGQWRYPEAEPRQSVPSGMCLVNSGALQMVVNALRRDGEEGKVVRAEMADELMSTVRQVQESQDALDAARYRYLRDSYWGDNKELSIVIMLQMNKIWDEKIDAAIAAQAKK